MANQEYNEFATALTEDQKRILDTELQRLHELTDTQRQWSR